MPTHSDSELSDSFDWDLLVQSRLNAILCGDSVTVDLTLTSLRDHLQLPLHEWSFRGGTPSPSIHTGTLIVTDVAGTTLEEQRAFLAWLDAHRNIRVITLSESPLYDLCTGRLAARAALLPSQPDLLCAGPELHLRQPRPHQRGVTGADLFVDACRENGSYLRVDVWIRR